MGGYKVALISGDGIGPEITNATLKVLNTVQEKFNLDLEFVSLEAGDAYFRKRETALPEETVEAIKSSHV